MEWEKWMRNPAHTGGGVALRLGGSGRQGVCACARLTSPRRAGHFPLAHDCRGRERNTHRRAQNGPKRRTIPHETKRPETKPGTREKANALTPTREYGASLIQKRLQKQAETPLETNAPRRGQIHILKRLF
jgi:hypothetical protein